MPGNHAWNLVGVVAVLSLIASAELTIPLAVTKEAQMPENLALKAQAQASSEHNNSYLAKFAVDGKIPVAGSQEDLGKAWCVRGETHRNGAEFSLAWPEPVTIAEIVYYGRTAWFAEECWKDYEVYLDASAEPVVHGRLQMGHGPQRITLAVPVVAAKLTLKFKSSYGGLNPGAAEIQVFPTSPPANALPKFVRLSPGRPEYPAFDDIAESNELKSRLAEGKLGFTQLLVIQRQELNPSHVYTYHVEGFGPGGMLGVYTLKQAEVAGTGNDSSLNAHPANLDLQLKGDLHELVASSTGQILDADLSYDGTTILFSWRRKKQEGYHLFTIRTDGTELRQITDGPQHDYNGCWLPDGGIGFLSTRSSRFAYCWVSPVGILYRMDADGSNIRRLSANIVNDFTPSVMSDGRIIYSRWEYVDKPAIPIQSLWTIHPDGTALAGFYGNRVLSPATFMEARSIPGRSQVLCTLTSHNGPARGAIGMIDIAQGNNAQQAIRNLTPEVSIGQVDKGDGNNIRGPYENPYPLDAEWFLVSHRGTLLARNYMGTQQAIILKPRNGLGFYSPQPIRSRPRPPVLSSQLTPEPQPWAVVVLEDVYRGLEPWVKRGEIKEICVVEEMKKAVRTDVANRAFGFQFPVISCGATYACKKVWGYAPVAEDGSACFKVPAGAPIYFMALDAQGRAVQRMRTFTHLMPGEVQGCIGCHESRQQVTAFKKPPLLNRQPDELRPPEWGKEMGFDYSSIIQPVLERYCVGCHSGSIPAGKIDLAGDKTDFFNVSYEFLARGRKRSGEAEWDSPYVSWIPTYNGMEQNILEVTPKAWGSPRSKLADLILSGHPDQEGKLRIQMEKNEMRRILAWIDLNVPYYGTSETAYPNMKGCRQIYPRDLDNTLAEVVQRRCVECHQAGKIPRQFWTRIIHPHMNAFLLAPLAKSAGGSQVCGKAVFNDTTDPDYQAIIKTFDPCIKMLQERPRMDMAGAQPAEVDRSCLGDVN